MTSTTGQTEHAHLLVAAHAWYGDTIGGSFRLASEFAQYAALRGYRVTYVCCNTTGNRPPQEDVDGVTVRRYRPPNGRVTGLGRLRYHVAQVKQLVQTVAAQQPVDAVSGHTPLQFLGAARALSGDSVFKSYVVHSPFDDELTSNAAGSRPSVGRRLAGAAAWWVEGRNVRLADRVQTDSEYTMRVMTRKHGRLVRHKGIVAPGWVDCNCFQPISDRHTARQSLGAHWVTDLPVFFTLRRLEARMGLDTLVRACAKLAADGLRFRTLIGGGGSLETQLQQMIDDAGLSDHVRLLGRLPEQQLATAYAAADCFVLPTRALECFGLIVLESFACRTPVIASSAAAIPELAERQGVDWMFEPGDVDQLAGRMRAFIERSLKPSVDLRRIAMEFDKPVVLDRWEQLLAPGAGGGSRQL